MARGFLTLAFCCTTLFFYWKMTVMMSCILTANTATAFRRALYLAPQQLMLTGRDIDISYVREGFSYEKHCSFFLDIDIN